MMREILSKQFIRYIIVGSFSTGMDFLLLYVLVEYFHLFYLVAAVISIALIFLLSFALNKYWTFSNHDTNYFNQFSKYTIVHLIAWGINLSILAFLVEIFGMWYLLAKVFGTAAAFIWNYFVSKNWVFKNNQK